VFLPDGVPEPGPLTKARILTLVIIGSDARPRQDFTRQRADSIHVLFLNTETKKGALLGIPRDTLASIPGRGRTKINAALAYGGPNLLLATLRGLLNVPVEKYVITGFAGFEGMVDEIGGINISVPRMNDPVSGAQFAGGWYAFNGKAALAYSRARKTIAGGDLGRSRNQGSLLLAALGKLRSETSTVTDLARWITVFQKHGKSNLNAVEFLQLAVSARGVDPAALTNLVIPANVGKQVTVSAAAGPLLAKLRAQGTP
jgi:polyisoprenyl-teichoic acid--peptidoglycan teichoic acid transferase